MINLGYQLTVYARGAYPLDQAQGDTRQLLGFNELQHRIYGRIRNLRRSEVWTLDSFLEGLAQKAAHYGIEHEFEAAIKVSLAFSRTPLIFR